MKSNNPKIRYIKLDSENINLAYDIQKTIFKDDPNYANFLSKLNNEDKFETCFIVYFEDNPIGITGTYLEDIDSKSIWLDWYGVLEEYRRQGFGKQILLDTINYCKSLNRFDYFRLDTTYWENRPVIKLYDDIMHLREEYTIEDTDTIKHNWLIYTYNLRENKNIEPWNNRNLYLNEHYENLI